MTRFIKNDARQGGFTLVELLVVIAIIGLLSSIVLAGLQTSRSKGRDARRLEDLNQIRTALFLYSDTYGNWIQSGSGCGSGGNGNGWFNHDYSGAPIPMSQCLVNAGLTPTEIIDPSGARLGSTPTNNVHTYMKYTCIQSGRVVTYLFTKLETKPQIPGITDTTCCPNCDTNYGMNYVLLIS
jgi:prepilin-type N-terminal cleavage/methylation domain-containing protein